MNRIPGIGNRITEIQGICLDLFLIGINQDQVITGVFQNHAVGQGRTHMPQTNNTNFLVIRILFSSIDHTVGEDSSLLTLFYHNSRKAD